MNLGSFMGNKYIALDTETGGVTSDVSLLTAFFMVLDENFNEVGNLSLLIKPDNGLYQVTGEALGINKINLAEHDKVAITEKEAGTKLYEFLSSMNPNGGDKLIPIGHNVAFDVKFLQGKIISQGTWNKFVSYRVLDTGVVATFLKAVKLLPNDLNGSLSSLAAHYGLNTSMAHTASGDVLMCVEIMKKMVVSVEHIMGFNRGM
jgi:DNA polymerase III alpha subunit (gram-positive type)